MELRIDRKWKRDTYTISNLYIDGKHFGNILEDVDRDLKQTDSLATILEKKVYGETAIPSGRYEILMNVYSPKYGSVQFYKDLCKGCVPRLKNVPGFDGVLIHTGNTPLDSYGCLICGKNTAKGKVTLSREYFKKIYKELKTAYDNGEKIYITIE